VLIASVDPEGWNHNAHYHDRLLAAVPRPCARALDVGCGLGRFARRLAAVSNVVDALDSNEDVVQQARVLSASAGHVRVVRADFMHWTAADTYDFISMVAVLHHLPFDDALRKSAALLRPGGVLAVLGLERLQSLLGATVQSLLAFPVSGYYRVTRGTSPVSAPILEPAMTLAEIRQRARAILPGATIRRHLLWRYSLIWTKPASVEAGAG
jgi:2-polyprenyl-3-methyl-5-hydroxy-6-metoxy-1,4-benzoquinol methylase